jgi:hypothetical protein
VAVSGNPSSWEIVEINYPDFMKIDLNASRAVLLSLGHRIVPV